MGVQARMALKAVLILATVGLVYSQGSHCSAFGGGANDGRDCTCGDKAFNECDEPNTNDQFHVNTLEAATWLEGHSATRRTSASKMFLTAPVLGFVLGAAQSATPTTYATGTSRLDARRKELNLQRVPEFPPSKAATPS